MAGTAPGPHPHRTSAIVLTIVLAAAVLPAHRALAGQPTDQPTDQEIQVWVEQLGHDQYYRRESATRKLAGVGPAAIPHLTAAMRSGDLEVVQRAVSVISDVALGHVPTRDGGAFDVLESFAANGAGRGSSLAADAVNEVRINRSRQAQIALADAGVFIGRTEFVILSHPDSLMIVEIDEDKWQGDLSALHWLRWLAEIKNVRLKGQDAVRPEVLEEVAQMPDLRSIAIVNAKLKPETLEPLQQIERIDSIEFRYVPLTDEQVGWIERIPIRVSLNLMGTGVSSERVLRLQEALPGLEIEHQQGGFLGVTAGQPRFNACMIETVQKGSAADKAGIVGGDVIVLIDGMEIKQFSDLKKAINQHLPGDDIEITYRRNGKLNRTVAKLGKLGT